MRLLAIALLGVVLPWPAGADRPHSPGIRGTIPIVLFRQEGPGFVPFLPRIQVFTERGRLVADVETVAELGENGRLIGRFEIPLRRAGSYLVSATGGVTASYRYSVEVSRKEFTELEMDWPPIPLPGPALVPAD